MKRWLPRLPLLLAGIAEVGGLMPLALVLGHLLPKEGPAGPGWYLPLPGGALSPLLLLLVWFGAWLINDRYRRHQQLLSPLLLAAALGVAWLAQPQALRSVSLVFPLFVLPLLVGAWWGGGSLGAAGLYWHTAFEGLRRSLYVCGIGLVILWLGGPPVSGALVGPLLLFGAGLTLLFLLRLEGGAIPLRTASVALAPLLVVALVALVANPAWIGWGFGLLGRILSPIVEVVALPVGYLAAWLQQWLLARRRPQEGVEPPPQEVQGEPLQQDHLVEITPQTIEFTSGLLLVVGAVALFFLVRWLMAKRRENYEPDEVDEVRTGPGVLRGLLGDLRRLLGAKKAPADPDPLPEGDPRRLLRRLQAWGERQGRARGAAETPATYAAALARQLPQGAQPTGLAALTSAYATARYGSGRPEQGQVQAAEELLRNLEQ